MSQIVNYINSNYLYEREIEGKGSNPVILAWQKRFFEWASDDSKIAWCSIFLWNIFQELGLSTNGVNASARSWLNWGKPCQPHYGCICVLWRGSINGWRGHVGIYIRETATHVLLLGGNQGDSVTYSWYKKSRILGFRNNGED